ncbi:Oidioi.mRNA.OKI2018_I69.chr1.g977.t1.cds [Oikopleura dioica]|uniref:Oidioi.mRNA.OKI2018_I69.PAR.g12806.t1.cds n=1 Tax=Oikopleura dioica TaxID=34765 RepID=A0ABN7S6I1_OIKDI|nr:Oidioi.mRNA.OKI2018_I69.PAR.g12806.t1.cds [Oikopleura dioica]CAG5103870.1 Oidioi.mRNA.OKI2018_I69.chr1.g977.t1.cds [Oikopleura dioica]
MSARSTQTVSNNACDEFEEMIVWTIMDNDTSHFDEKELVEKIGWTGFREAIKEATEDAKTYQQWLKTTVATWTRVPQEIKSTLKDFAHDNSRQGLFDWTYELILYGSALHSTTTDRGVLNEWQNAVYGDFVEKFGNPPYIAFTERQRLPEKEEINIARKTCLLRLTSEI